MMRGRSPSTSCTPRLTLSLRGVLDVLDERIRTQPKARER
jgi:hypothetical protein